jgi:hypothetical protein
MIFRSSGVNRVLIFETNPRNHLNEQDLMQLAAFLGVFWTLTFLSFIYGGKFFLPVRTYIQIKLLGQTFNFFVILHVNQSI